MFSKLLGDLATAMKTKRTAICTNQKLVLLQSEFNHIKSGVVTFGECKPVHYENMNEREWLLGDESVDELYEYKNLGVVKNFIT